ncbi:MAG: enoyl-CoA hydratase/isomerase family protein [Deltaproteobacteria bacterium]|nr:enoyl-CoA hydratase/isomerase family protein [Deltaproteobacteria bacterium]MBI3078464.1 enoyl-CoA hydratase/isomerase family protein [Deltaproteobacteria bacterium]
MANKLVNYSTDRGLAIIELNNPPANSYGLDLLRELDDAIIQARLDEDVHVLVLRGAGDRFFCAGADIKMLNESSPAGRYNFALFGNETLQRLERTPKLVIAALNGHATGGGLEIAMACDIRLARKGGGRVGVPEVNLGAIPGMGGTQRLPRLIGRGRAIELMTTGRLLEFEEAHALGIVNQVLESDGFWEKVLEYARQFVVPNRASAAVGWIKRAVTSGLDASLDVGLAVERELLQQAFTSEDLKEGTSAFLEKRKAVYKGR